MNQPQGYTVEAQRNAQIRHELTLRGATLIYTRRRNSNYQNPLEQETTIFSFADLHVATRNARLWESFIQQHCVVRRAISIVANVDRRVLAVVVSILFLILVIVSGPFVCPLLGVALVVSLIAIAEESCVTITSPEKTILIPYKPNLYPAFDKVVQQIAERANALQDAQLPAVRVTVSVQRARLATFADRLSLAAWAIVAFVAPTLAVNFYTSGAHAPALAAAAFTFFGYRNLFQAYHEYYLTPLESRLIHHALLKQDDPALESLLAPRGRTTLDAVERHAQIVYALYNQDFKAAHDNYLQLPPNAPVLPRYIRYTYTGNASDFLLLHDLTHYPIAT